MYKVKEEGKKRLERLKKHLNEHGYITASDIIKISHQSADAALRLLENNGVLMYSDEENGHPVYRMFDDLKREWGML